MIFGAANEFFYYSYTKDATFNINLRMVLKEKLQLLAFETAVEKALANYPELKICLGIENNQLTAEENTRPVKFYPKSDRRYCYCSEETNGYPFYFTYEESAVTLRLFHGWTDFSGFMTFLRTVFYYYAQSIGFTLSEEELAQLLPTIRTEAPNSDSSDVEDLYDPYRKYQDADAKPSFTADPDPAYSISYEPFEDGCGYTKSYTLEIRTSDFIAETKRNKVSFVPLMIDILCSAVRKAFPVGDETVTAMVPVDLRPLFGSSTVTNFSDGIRIPFYKSDEAKSQEERCAAFKERMLAQKTKENFALLLAQKSAVVDSFKNDSRPLFESVAERRKPRKPGTPSPVTFALSYPGKISFSPGIDRLIGDVFLEPLCRVHSLIVYTYGDAMRFFIINRTDDPAFPECFLNEFRSRGFSASFVDEGYRTIDQLELERI